MTFEITYSGSSVQYKVAASTPERKGDEFYDKMDSLSSRGQIQLLDLMLDRCREYFDDFDYQNEGFGEIDFGDGYEEFNSDGRIAVDGEEIDMGDEWKDAYEQHKSEPLELRMKLTKQNWSVVYYVQWKSSWSATIEEDKFDKEKLHWKNSMVYYGDTPIEEDIAGRRPIAEEIYLLFNGEEHSF